MGFSITSSRRRREIVLSDQLKEVRQELDHIKSISLNDPRLARIFAGTYDQGAGKLGELKDPLYQIPIVYACIRARAVNLAQVPFLLYRKGTEDVITSGPLVDLFLDPNPLHSRFSLWEGVVTSLDAKGNAFLVPDPEEVGGVPVNLWLFNPDMIKPAKAKDGEEWIGWWLTRPRQEPLFLEKSQVIHIKNYNLNNQVMGANPLEVARATNILEWDAVRYNESFFTNDGTPSVAYISEKKLPERRKKELEKALVSDLEGVDKSHKGVLLQGGLDVKQLGISQKDMEFLAGRKFNREEITMIYKVPKAEVELYEDMNYATATSADRSFWKKTEIPLGRMIQEEINRKFLYQYNVEGRYDFMAIDALNAELLEKAEAADTYVRMGYPLNVVNDRLNLGFPDVPHGDEPMEFGPQISLTAPDGSTKSFELPMIGGPMGTVDAEEIARGIRGKKWTAIMERILPIVGRATKDVRRYFYDVTKKLQKILAKGNYTALEKDEGERIRILLGYPGKIADEDIRPADLEIEKATERRELQVSRRAWRLLEKQFEELPEDEILAAFSDEDLREALEKHVLAALAAGLDSIAASPVMLEDQVARQILEEKLIKVLEINDTAKTEIIEELRRILLEGASEGIGEAELADRISDGMASKMKDIQKRARTIARTEIGSSFSQARWAAVEATEPKGIRWISSRDSKVRDTHGLDVGGLDGKTTPVGTAFVTSKGNHIRFPHDPTAAASEVINCRCTFEPVYSEEEL